MPETPAGPVLAIDFGGTKTAIASVNEDGQIIARSKLPAAHTLNASVAQVADAAREFQSAGVIVPGIYDAKSGSAWAPNLWGHQYVPLRDALEHRLGRRVVIASDRTGYVVGEQWLGAARGMSHVLFVAVGTGIGVGILSGGRVIEGAHGIAGAAGWMAVRTEWRDQYSRSGCWESEAAGPAVARNAGVATAEEAVAAARAGNAVAAAALDECARWLGMGIANLISVFDPEMVVLGGGLMQASDLLLPGIRAEVQRWAQPVAARFAGIEVTQLNEDAGLLGAARLALDLAERD